jgi:hypothetical protein
MLKDLLNKERQKLWLVSGFSQARTPACGQAGTAPGEPDEVHRSYLRRNADFAEHWPRPHDVLAIARASSGI